MSPMKRWGYVGAWAAVATLVTLAAWQVVGAAQERVGEEPLAPVVAITSGAGSASSSSSSTTTGSSPVEPTSAGGLTSSSPFPSPPSTTVPRPATTTTTAPPAAAGGSATIPSPGGTVSVSYRNGQVFLDAASPALGFAAEVEDSGPDDVRVRFESDAFDVTVRARWDDGALRTEVSTSGGDDPDDDDDDDGEGD